MSEISNVYGILYGCPYIEREEGCPFLRFNPLSFDEKLDKINSLSGAEIQKLIDYHFVCFNERKNESNNK
jgi:hypothetical protein